MERLTRRLAAAALGALGAGGLMAGAFAETTGQAPVQLAQGGFGFGQGLGQGFGQGQGFGFGQGFPGGGGIQGGAFPGGGGSFNRGGIGFGGGVGNSFGSGLRGGSTFFGAGPAQGSSGGRLFDGVGLAAGQVVTLTAFCTELFADAPTAATRFTGGQQARVAARDGSLVSLDQALEAGLLAVRGTNHAFRPLGGGLALQLQLVNTSRVPLQIDLQPGTTVTPAGQAPQPLPRGAERLFILARQQGLSANLQQFAVWAARGSTAEDVEQTNLVRLKPEEVKTVQGLLDGAGIETEFDRHRGSYERRWESLRAKVTDLEDVAGSVMLPGAIKAAIEGLKAKDGTALVRLTPARGGGTFFYGATLKGRKDGKADLRLYHLVTGQPLRVTREAVPLTPRA
jgi:hypothetical protein